ncbi:MULTISPECIES: hypothetical protein [unclassified Streptomyces]|uniref:hypothetical protein n=1 Tax=unclassified Streptomyces TaxID=2593676 RepID=UPI002E364527|nr:hypothetical protein [Streptomyces sp. NBC_01280]
MLGNDVARAGPSSVCPKTKKSRRTPGLTPEQVELFQRLCKGRQPTGRIFTAPEGGVRHSASSTPTGGSLPRTLSTPSV